MTFMTLYRAAPLLPMASLAKIVGNTLIKSCHRICFGRSPGFVTGDAGFRFHFSLMHVVIEANRSFGSLEYKITLFCGGIGEDVIFVLGS